MRESTVERKTKETDIRLFLSLDGEGRADIHTGVGFLDHMLTLFACHSGFDLSVQCVGDTEVDDHHTTEDIGIALGQAFARAIGDKRGITRYADTTLPMDESLILSAVDISGRGMLCFDLPVRARKVGTFDTELVKEFFIAFATNAKITLHIRKICGDNSHHIIEGAFKSVAHTMGKAVRIDEGARDRLPSTKGVIE